MTKSINLALTSYHRECAACDQRKRAIRHRLKLIQELMEGMRRAFDCFEKAPGHFKIDHFTILELKFQNGSYITNHSVHRRMIVIPEVGAKTTKW